MIEFLLERVKAMAESTKNKPWQHEMAFEYAYRAYCKALATDPECQETTLLRSVIEMAWPEFPLDVCEADVLKMANKP